VINQKLKIKSRQIFEEHIDSYIEEHDGLIEKFENGLKIVYDNIVILVQDEMVLIHKENMKWIIEKEKKNIGEYHTPYGIVEVELQGKEVRILEEPVILKLSYWIKIGNAKEYVNELQIECL